METPPNSPENSPTKQPTKNKFFQQNALCNELHNGQEIWFSKFEFALQDFSEVEKLENEVIFICGNSDCSFSERMAERKPPNVRKIYATNSICSDNETIFSLPIGIESAFSANRTGHGQGFSFASQKEEIIRSIQPKQTKNLIYSNFLIDTNPSIRQFLFNNLRGSHITKESGVPMSHFFEQIAYHEAVLCPVGNGLDTVRTYETFYCGKVPIIYGSDQVFKQLFFDMPCVYVSSVDEINDESYISAKINEAKNRTNFEKAYLDYWITAING